MVTIDYYYDPSTDTIRFSGTIDNISIKYAPSLTDALSKVMTVIGSKLLTAIRTVYERQ